MRFFVLALALLVVQAGAHTPGHDASSALAHCDVSGGDLDWTGPFAGDPIALGDQWIPARAWLRTEGGWKPLPIVAGIRLRQVDLTTTWEPPLVIGLEGINCDVENGTNGAMLARWNPGSRLYLGRDVGAARYGGQIRVTVRVRDDLGGVIAIVQWRGEATPSGVIGGEK